MPRFELIKHPSNDYDSAVSMTFTAEMVDVAKAYFDDFLKASGFELPLDDEPEFKLTLTTEDFLAAQEDWLWDDAFASKFRNAGPVGATGADVLPFPSSND